MTFTGDISGALRSGLPGDPASATSAGGGYGGALRPGDSVELGVEATRYEIVRSLGTGGMAEVFLVRRLGPAGFARPVALKCILTGLDVDESTRRAFVYEAQLVSKLRHPNIAEAYDFAFVGDRYYLVLEYVDGVTVRRVLRAARSAERRLTEGLCCHVAASVAEALYHAHTLVGDDGKPLGIVHRDVTAMNAMVARSGAVKLLDFGVALARLEGRERTRTGQFRGTFVYASPEQALGEHLDGRSDLFSLGVVLLEMLTGVRVFDADTDIGTMHKITECSREEVRAATEGLPRELAGICLKALARDPGDRYQDGAAFSRALREYLTGRGITYGPSDSADELQSLRVFDEVRSAEPRSESVADDVSDAGPSGRASITRAPEPASSPLRRSWGRRSVATAAVLAAAALLVTAWVKFPRRAHPETISAAAPMPTAEPVRPQESVASAGPRTEGAPAMSAAGPEALSELVPIVRPKRATDRARTATAERVKPPAQPILRDRSSRTSSAEFADRATVGDPRATLPRGTLIPVKLLRALAGQHPGQAEAVVTEEVAADGAVLVPKGSSVTCSARPPADGRVRLSCDTINTSERVLRFSGIAIGDGQHVGLRLLDDQIAAGTPFVVYVNAPAALR